MNWATIAIGLEWGLVQDCADAEPDNRSTASSLSSNAAKRKSRSPRVQEIIARDSTSSFPTRVASPVKGLERLLWNTGDVLVTALSRIVLDLNKRYRHAGLCLEASHPGLGETRSIGVEDAMADQSVLT